MSQMDQHSTLRIPESLYNKTENAIGNHIDRICLSLHLSCKDFSGKYDNQYNIKSYFQFPCRPAHAVKSRDQIALTASCKNTINTGTHHRRNHTDRKDIEHHGAASFEQSGSEPVSQRHEEYAAEQTHIVQVSAEKPVSINANTLTVNTPYTVCRIEIKIAAYHFICKRSRSRQSQQKVNAVPAASRTSSALSEKTFKRTPPSPSLRYSDLEADVNIGFLCCFC